MKQFVQAKREVAKFRKFFGCDAARLAVLKMPYGRKETNHG